MITNNGGFVNQLLAGHFGIRAGYNTFGEYQYLKQVNLILHSENQVGCLLSRIMTVFY